MQNGFVTDGDDKEKMSKSLGNFVTVHDIIKTLDPQILRFLMATTQYRRPIQYSQKNITDATNNLQRIQTAYDNLTYRQKDAQAGSDDQIHQQVLGLVAEFKQAMDDDFNAQNAIAAVYELVKVSNVYAQQATVQQVSVTELQETMAHLMSVFGIILETDQSLDDDKIKALIEQRNQARKDHDFALSDQIRDDLKAQGIVLEDTPQGTRYRKE